MAPRIVVVGAGVAGLATAFELVERAERLPGGVELLCIDGADRPGGVIRSTREEGYLWEWSANGVLDDAPTTITLVRRLGLAPRLTRARAGAAARYVLRRGRLRRLPTSPRELWGSDLLSWPGKLRLVLEPWVRPQRREGDESVHDFARRRLGREGADVPVSALVAGLFAGDPRRLSVASTLPALVGMEREHGSLWRGLRARERLAEQAAPPAQLASFPNGLQELTDALAHALGPRLRLKNPVRLVSDLGRRGFRVHTEHGAPIEVDAVVLACPPWQAAELIAAADATLAGLLRTIESAPMAVVQLGFPAIAGAAPPEGSGFFAPRGHGARSFGVLWPSNLFEQRAPEGALAATVLMGGALDPQVMDFDDESLVATALDDLKRVIGIAAEPNLVRVVRWPRALPQYVVGHGERLAAIMERTRARPGLWLAGAGYRGSSVNACIEQAPGLAENLLDELAGRLALAAD